jgi:alpha-L-arabinofuranosidase
MKTFAGRFIALGVVFLLHGCGETTETIYVNLEQAKVVSPIIYGWHYEEIGMIGEGGLHAEMDRNRGFEEANPPGGLVVEDGLYANVPAPEGQNKRVYDIDPLIGWGTIAGPDNLSISRVDINPLNQKNPHSLEVSVKQVSDEPAFGVFNSGFFGMHLKKELDYRLSFYLRAEGYSGSISVFLADSAGNLLSSEYVIDNPGKDWQKYEALLKATSDANNAILLFTPSATGKFWLDVVSLFPSDTWDNGNSIFRADIMQNLMDYQPDFIRFPGGCIVHGVNVETMYYWKETIGDIAERPGAWSKWKPNYRTDGLGYHEFYELCEYLGADAMYVAPTGLVCTGWVFQDGDSDHHFHPQVNVQDYVQDCLDAIEYAIGPVDSQWGAERAKNGHPEPFPLKYVSIGNEDFGPMYYENYDAFYRAIKEKYPQLRIIANSIIGNTPDRTDKRKRLPEFHDLSTVEIFDEHYYKDLDWVIENYDKFDLYERPGPDLMIGELGISGEHPLNILGEAIFMMMVERNADLNPISADRPLMRNWTFVEGRGNPMYYHTNNLSWKTFNYYHSKMFRDNTQNIWYESVHTPVNGMQGVNFETLYTSAGRDTKTGDLLLKVVNLTDNSRDVSIHIGDKAFSAQVNITVLTAEYDQRNTPDNPYHVVPVTKNQTFEFPSKFIVEPRSFTVLRINMDHSGV